MPAWAASSPPTPPLRLCFLSDEYGGAPASWPSSTPPTASQLLGKKGVEEEKISNLSAVELGATEERDFAPEGQWFFKILGRRLSS